jgi:hypothetical protein
MNYLILAFLVILPVLDYGDDQLKEIKFSLSGSGFVTSWLVRGSFDCKTDQMRVEDYLVGEGGEGRVYTNEDLQKISANDKAYKPDKWRLHVSDSHLVNFNSLFTPNEHVLGYALCLVESSKQQEVFIKLGSDDGVQVWLNGKLAHNNPIYRGVQIDDDTIKAELRKGRNSILVKVNQGEGNWGFCLRLTDRENRPLSEGITVVLPALLQMIDIEKQLAQSVKVSAVLDFSSGNGLLRLNAYSDIGLPHLDKTLLVKSYIGDVNTKPIAEVINERFDFRSGVSGKEVTWDPKRLTDGMYILYTKILDENGDVLVSKDTPIFLRKY